jgi:cytochrome c-type biogenesis protein CcmH
LIWLVLAAVAGVVVMTLWTARTNRERIIVGLVALVGAGAYWWIGRPELPGQPLESRMAALEARAATDAESFNAAEVMALLQHRARKAPDDPLPHKFMGDILQGAGEAQQAMLAYQAALRRAPGDAAALAALADLRFKMAGALDETTAGLYVAAWQADPSNPRIGYMAGLADWQAGRKDEAQALWARIEESVPREDPRQQMFRALREMFAPESLATSPGSPNSGPPAR